MAPLGRYSIVAADGWAFDFDPTKWNVDAGIPDGFGLPPVQHQTSQPFNLPGKLLDAINAQPRTVVISASLHGTCLDDLHNVRYKLWKTMRWNRTLDNPPAPFKLYYRNNNKRAYLNCYLLDAPTDEIGNDEKNQKTAIKLVAYDPMWYAENGSEAALSPFANSTYTMIAAKIGGTWSNLGGVGTGTVYAMAISPDGNTLIVGGDFLNWAGIANADYIVAYNLTTGVWSALSTGADGIVRDLAFAADGTLYATGDFANAGGVACSRVAKWNGIAWSALGAGLNQTGFCLAVDSTGGVYVGGFFTTANGVACNYIARWNGTTFTALGTGLAPGPVCYAYDIVIAPDGSVYVGGIFTTANGVTCNNIAKWNGTTFVALGSGIAGIPVDVFSLALGPDGMLYATGLFTTAGGVSALNIAKWNGATWFPLGSGLNNVGGDNNVAVDSNGILYAGGTFTQAGSLILADRIAQWNGSAWSHLDIDLPGAPNVYCVITHDEDLFVGFDTSGAVPGSDSTSVTVAGDSEPYPIFTITGPGVLEWIENDESLKRMIFSCQLVASEIATIDLSPAIKTFSSNIRGNLFPYAAILPQSDFASFRLEVDPVAASGVNSISMYMGSTTPVEQNDNNNQLSGWANITGVTYLNTDTGGRIYVSIIADGGGFYHVALYDDAARTHLVGHTATYNGAGAKAIVADNASGLGGTVTVDAVVAADADIVVYFATAKIEWRNAFLSADSAVQ